MPPQRRTRYALLRSLCPFGKCRSLAGLRRRGFRAGSGGCERPGRSGFGRSTGAGRAVADGSCTGHAIADRNGCHANRTGVRDRPGQGGRSGPGRLQGGPTRDRVTDRRQPRMPFGARMAKEAAGIAGRAASAATNGLQVLSCAWRCLGEPDRRVEDILPIGRNVVWNSLGRKIPLWIPRVPNVPSLGEHRRTGAGGQILMLPATGEAPAGRKALALS